MPSIVALQRLLKELTAFDFVSVEFWARLPRASEPLF
jgi:hypothetical protein